MTTEQTLTTNDLRGHLRDLRVFLGRVTDDRLRERGERAEAACRKWLDDVDAASQRADMIARIRAQEEELARDREQLAKLRRVGSSRDPRIPAGVPTGEVRAWAEEQGLIEPGKRGRLSKSIADAWAAREVTGQ